MPPVQIADLRHHEGERVTMQGWVMTTRSSGKIAFLVRRAGAGSLQCVVWRKQVPEAVWQGFQMLSQETSVAVEGTVRAEPRAPGGYELGVSDLRALGPSVDFPIGPKDHGTQFLFKHRHLWLRSRRQV